MPKFSVVLIAKNEARTLPKLINSLNDFQNKGGEICLLDTGSTDQTVQIAKDFGLKVEEVGDKYSHEISLLQALEINQKFIDPTEQQIVKEGDKYFDFSSARNHATSLASNDWVCTVDADEVLTHLNIEKIDEIISDPHLAHLEYEFIFAHDPDGKPAIQFLQSKFFKRQSCLISLIARSIRSMRNKRLMICCRSAGFWEVSRSNSFCLANTDAKNVARSIPKSFET